MNYSDKQCRHYYTVEKALRYLQQRQQDRPSLAQVAEHCALSEYHFQRLFRDWAGVSPKRFLQHLTREEAKARLRTGSNVLLASEESGLSSPGRLHDLIITLEAVTPGEIRSGGKELKFQYGIHPSPFGYCFIVINRRGIHQLAFLDSEDCSESLQQLTALWPQAEITSDPQVTGKIVTEIFEPKQRSSNTLKLWVRGTHFQFKVWEALLKIPQESLCSYGDIAEAIGQPTASRAVGSAVAKNAVAVLIPCHRVIQSMGTFGQYRWGEFRKQALLGSEAATG